MSRSRISAAGLLLVATTLAAQTVEEDLSVVSGWREHTDASNALYRHIQRELLTRLDARDATIAALQTRADWVRYQDSLRETLRSTFGAFPERTPLRVRATGTLERDTYRVEKILYESVPSYYVTAAVFVPKKRSGRAPAILFCSGHSLDGFRASAYQTMILNLVDKGFVVLAFDPVGQGERLQYLEPRLRDELVTGPTKEHSYPGAQQLIAGDSPARLMTWDGIRGIDVLVARDDVDPERIGVAGRSGGGTQTAYIMALDDRVAAAAPEAYITSFRRLLSSAGPQDAEQNPLHAIANGIDHADFLHARAPKPTLIIATTRDFFSIHGARETLAEVSRHYAARGAADSVAIAEDDAEHASTKANREAMYRFFQTALELPGDASERDIPHLSAEELRVTDTGQIETALHGETLFSLNRARDAVTYDPGHVVLAARRLSGFVAPAGVPRPVFTGRYLRDGYVVEKYFIDGEGDYVIPYLLLRSDTAESHPGLIYLHPDGKAAEAAPGSALEALVRAGYTVLAPDLLGTGEMGPGSLRGDAHFGNTSYNTWFGAMLAGRSIVGIQAGDVVRLARVLSAREDVSSDGLTLVGRDSFGPVALHAAAFESAFGRAAIVGSLVTYRSIVDSRIYPPERIPGSVPAALTAYDLPDLIASLEPRPFFEAADDAALVAWLESTSSSQD